MKTVSQEKNKDSNKWIYPLHGTKTLRKMLEEIKVYTGDSFASTIRRLVYQEYERILARKNK